MGSPWVGETTIANSQKRPSPGPINPADTLSSRAALCHPGGVRLTRRPVILVLIALAAFVLIPVTYFAGAAYVVETQVWNPTYRTYAYAERPGAGIALIATLVLCLALAGAAIGALALAVRAWGTTADAR